MIRILLVDDHPVVRHGIRSILLDRFRDAYVAEAGDAPTALREVDAADWDIVLLDISLPGPSGLDLIKQLHSQRPALPLLVAGQAVLGACWAGVFVAGLSAVKGWPTRLGNGLALGGWFCMLSLAAAGRISLDKVVKVDALTLEMTALALWLAAAVVAWQLFDGEKKHVAA